MIDIALYYASKNWPVFPLKQGGKMPAIPKERGGRGHLDATLDTTQIGSWWATYPRANVGIATGARSGLLVIDCDPRKTPTWLASVNELALPPTFSVRTASGGFHLYFNLPPQSKISIGTDLLPGIDWRGNGGYVVGAGSVVNDVIYTIARAAEIAPAPTPLLDRLERHRHTSSIVISPSGGTMVVSAGRRNDMLFRMACGLRRFGIGQSAIQQSLTAINAAHCLPVLSDQEIAGIAASAVRYPPSAVRAGEGR